MQLVVILVFFTASIAAQTAKVSNVSDGDSFILASGERVRMIGINAPELADKFGPESKEHLATLIRGKTVTLERDPLNDDRDVHGRLLRFVILDGTDINRRMIEDGYAYAFLRYRFAQQRRERYREAENAAKAAKLGIWATASSQNRPADPPSSTPNTPANESGSLYANAGWIAAAAAILLVVIVLVVRSRRRR